MKPLLICYPKCSTCKKTEVFLKQNNIEYLYRNIVEDCPTYDELRSWIERSKLDIKKFFNTTGLVYKELNLKEKLSIMTDKEKIELLSTNGMLIKRPILISEDKVLVGFKLEEWKEL